ncbi:hypothetical protein MSAN_00455200 [Mycena sanguinolenta]|uniref:Uncharacterized protein n=1 Tax=Mycena sanguinolenta TaxID=230812 RepID=A0A8H6ZEZ7_9AGAR|nr:hypothetical protein MSAN_00455200 [Mycena sanguinolenta]
MFLQQRLSVCFLATVPRCRPRLTSHASLTQFCSRTPRKINVFYAPSILGFRTYSSESEDSVPRARYRLSCLRSEDLGPWDFLDLGGCRERAVHFQPGGPRTTLFYARTAPYTPFPAHARGYLYYHPPSPRYPFSGSVRLRIQSNEEHGTDLLLPNGTPWQIVLPQMVTLPSYAGLLKQLLREDLVTSETVDQCRELFWGRKILHPNTLIFRLDQPFSILMTQAHVSLTTVGRSKLGTFKKPTEFGSPFGPYPYKGVILARFELSAEGTHMYLRVVKIVERLFCVRSRHKAYVVPPKEGEAVVPHDRWRSKAMVNRHSFFSNASGSSPPLNRPITCYFLWTS